MGREYNELVTPSEFIDLKNRIKNEVKRRKYIGDISEYGGSEHDYTKQPSIENTIDLEHINKISEITGLIDDTNIQKSHVNGDIITEIIILDAEITRFESAKVDAGATGCKSSCTGMCSTSCSTACTGCGSGCSGSCTSGCTNSCSGCGGSCSYSCSGCSGCGGSCSSSCGDWCQQTCGNNNCSGTCANASAQGSGGCGNSCAYGCLGVSDKN